MSASFYRVFLLVVLVLGTSFASASEASAASKPGRARLLPSVRAKIKGYNRLHRPIYRTYRG